MQALRIAILLFILLSFINCDNDILKGSGNVISEVRTVEDFHKIEVEDALEIEIRQSDTKELEVRADDNIITKIQTEVVGNNLKIGFEDGFNVKNSITAEVYVSTSILENLIFKDAVDGQLINFVNIDKLEINVNDASTLKMSGSAVELTASVNDASVVEAFAFDTNICTVDLNDASKMEITCNDLLKGSVKDASELRYKGNPTIEITTSGAGKVKDAN